MFAIASVYRHILLQIFNIRPAQAARLHAGRQNIADLHGRHAGEGHGYNILAVQLAVDHATAHGVALQADQQIKQGGAVPHPDIFAAHCRAEDLFRKIKGIVIPLLKGQIRIRRQIVKRHCPGTGERVIAAEKHMRVGGKQGRKIQIGSPQQLLQRRAIKVIEIQQADLAFALCHILNDLVGLRLSQRDVVAVAAPLPDQVHKGVYRKGIMLGGNCEFLLIRTAFCITVQ